MYKFFSGFIKPLSKDEDQKRREFIFNILVSGTLVLSVVSLLRILIMAIFLQKSLASSFNMLGAITLIMLILYYFSRRGYFTFSSYVLVFLLLVGSGYTSINWGVDVPQALLIYSLVIIMAGILVSTRFAFLITLVISIFLVSVTYLQVNSIIEPRLNWMDNKIPQYGDVLVYSFTLFIITIVSWLGNRELTMALKRAHKSEAELKNERDLLEVKVEERTRELNRIQQEKMLQFNHFAEMGRSTAGILHDIANPLTYLSLNLDKLHKDSQHLEASNYSNIRDTVEKALGGTRKMQSFTDALLNQLKQHKVRVKFDLIYEIKQVIELFSYKARYNHVELFLHSGNDNEIYYNGDPLKFNQLIGNLISNAIDSYHSSNKENKKVLIRAGEKNCNIIIEVEDFGIGIEKADQASIFKPFYTTKEIDRGTGIGLSNSQYIASNEFHGKIFFKSRTGEGTVFTVELPVESEK